MRMFQGAAMKLIETVIFFASDYSFNDYNFKFCLSLSSSRGETKKIQDSILSDRNVRAVTVPNLWNFGQNHKEF